jgi:hypothetical protein
MKTGGREDEDENRCIDRTCCHGGRRRAGFHEQRLQEKPAQLVCPDLKRSASRQKLNQPHWLRSRGRPERPWNHFYPSSIRETGASPLDRDRVGNCRFVPRPTR